MQPRSSPLSGGGWAIAAIMATSFLFFPPRPAMATYMVKVRTSCPACTAPFSAWRVESWNNLNGIDMDLCSHARGHQPLHYVVWTCPRCHFSALESSFGDSLDPALVERIRRGLRPAISIKEAADQKDIPPWVKYDLALQVLDLRGDRIGEREELLRSATWATRLEGHRALVPVWEDLVLGRRLEVAFEGLSEATSAQPSDLPGILGRTVVDLDAAGEVVSKATVRGREADPGMMDLLAAAWTLRVRGELIEAQEALDILGAMRDVPGPVEEAIRTMAQGIARERVLLGRWLEAMEDSGGRGDGTRTDVAIAPFHRAEVLRRLGRIRESARSYFTLVGSLDASPLHRRIAMHLLRRRPPDWSWSWKPGAPR